MTAFKDHFSPLAAQYAQFRPVYPSGLFEYLAGLAVRHELAWDCACGSGQATRALAEHFRSVIGTDASREQLAAARPHPGVEYRVAVAEQSGLAEGSVDLIAVAQALHWFDVERFYREADRVMRPGGVLAVWTYGPLVAPGSAIDAPLQEFYRDIVGSYWPPERRLVDAGYRTLPFPYPELTPPAFRMEQRWPLPHLLGYVGSWSATRRFIEARGEDPVTALGERLQPLWGDPREPRLITWPLSLRVGAKSGAAPLT